MRRILLSGPMMNTERIVCSFCLHPSISSLVTFSSLSSLKKIYISAALQKENMDRLYGVNEESVETNMEDIIIVAQM